MAIVTPETLDNFIKTAQARKVLPFQLKAYFLQYFDIDSVSELSTAELELVNKKLSQRRYPTVDDSDVPLAEEVSQDQLWTKRIGN